MLRHALLAAIIAIFATVAGAFELPAKLDPIELPDLPGFKPLTINALPNLEDETEKKVTKSGKVHVNGLVSTINFECFKKRQADGNEEVIHLTKEETGFGKEITVRLYRQSGKAPLAVTFLGFEQKATDKLARAWQAYLYECGCHVLSFDSLICNEMNEATCHGVAGNCCEEAVNAVKIINTVLDHTNPDAKEGRDSRALRERVTSVRLLGTSYGGLLALQTLRQPDSKRWPIDRVLVLSTPLNMATTAKRLDTFAREDKPFFGVFKLMKLVGGYTPKEGIPNPQEEALMRAGIGYCFHGDLTSLAKSNIDRYVPDLLDRLHKLENNPNQSKMDEEMIKTIEDRQDEEMKALKEKYKDGDQHEYDKEKDALKAKFKIQKMVAKRHPSDVDDWNFQDYALLLLKPYWKIKYGTNNAVTLDALAAGAPNFVQIFIAEDDPLNDPKDLEEARKKMPEPRLETIPHGGHLGYVGTHWAETLITKYFDAKK
jgi:predicted alpha/beta-fold hydrolase